MGSEGYLIGQDEVPRFHSEWGIDKALSTRGGLTPAETQASTRQVWLLQRKSSKVGSGLAKTTG